MINVRLWKRYLALLCETSQYSGGENHVLLDMLTKVSNAAARRGILVLDRGGDRRRLYKPLLDKDRPVRFIIRQKGERHILYGGRPRETVELAEKRVCLLLA